MDELLQTIMHVVHRKTGKLHHIKYEAETFFFLHTINAFEVNDCIVIDIASYKNAAMLDCMFVEALKVYKNELNILFVIINEPWSAERFV